MLCPFIPHMSSHLLPIPFSICFYPPVPPILCHLLFFLCQFQALFIFRSLVLIKEVHYPSHHSNSKLGIITLHVVLPHLSQCLAVVCGFLSSYVLGKSLKWIDSLRTNSVFQVTYGHRFIEWNFTRDVVISFWEASCLSSEYVTNVCHEFISTECWCALFHWYPWKCNAVKHVCETVMRAPLWWIIHVPVCQLSHSTDRNTHRPVTSSWKLAVGKIIIKNCYIKIHLSYEHYLKPADPCGCSL